MITNPVGDRQRRPCRWLLHHGNISLSAAAPDFACLSQATQRERFGGTNGARTTLPNPCG